MRMPPRTPPRPHPAPPAAVTIEVRRLSADDLDSLGPQLAQLLIETVDGGTPMGFMPPLSRQAAGDYFRSLRGELQASRRLLLAAFAAGHLVGTGQIVFSPWTNSLHRAEVQKVFVAKAARGLGVGRALMDALHANARQHGRSLLVLNTRHGESAQGFYRAFGYREAGIVPGWTLGPAGERYDHVTMYRQLA